METYSTVNCSKTWLKTVLVPFWVTQIFFSLVYIGLFAWIISGTTLTTGFTGTIIDIVYLVLNVVCLTFNLAEIFLFARGVLNPGTYLGLNIAKIALWTIVLIANIVALSVGTGSLNRYDFVSFAIVIIIYLGFLGSLIYGSVVHYNHARAKKAAEVSRKNPDQLTESSPTSNVSSHTYIETKTELPVANKGFGPIEAGGDPAPTTFEVGGKPLQAPAELDSRDDYGAHQVGYDEVYEMGYSNTRPNSQRRLTGPLHARPISERRRTGELFLGADLERGRLGEEF